MYSCEGEWASPLHRQLSPKNTKYKQSYSIWPVIVVSHKRVEGTQLHPSYAQFLSGVASKATDVCPYKGHPEQTKLKHPCGGSTKSVVHLNISIGLNL